MFQKSKKQQPLLFLDHMVALANWVRICLRTASYSYIALDTYFFVYCNTVVYVILSAEVNKEVIEKRSLMASMKQSVKIHLNPLFGITDIVIADSLPRTASNKVMRRLLRDEYTKSISV